MHGPPDHKRTLARRAQARYRKNLAAGCIIAPVKIGPALLEYLVSKLHWVAEADAGDRQKVGEAIEAGLREMAEAEERS